MLTSKSFTTFVASALVFCLMTHAAAAQNDVISLNKAVKEKITKQDPRDRYRKQSHVRSHVLNLQKGKAYRIDVTSSDLDPYIRIMSSAGKVLATNNNGGDGTNARLLFVPTNSTRHRLVVTTSKGGQTGAYQVLMQEYTSAGSNHKRRGNLSNQSPKTKNGRAYVSMKYRFKAGREYRIDVTSTAFDPVLYLRDSSARVLSYDDDGGVGLNSRLLFVVPKSGVYELMVLAYENGNFGPFNLTMRRYKKVAGGGPVVLVPGFPTQARMVMTRWLFPHGRVDSIRSAGIRNTANPKGQPVPGAANLIHLISTQPNPLRITLDMDKKGQAPRDPDAVSPLVTAADTLSSGMSLVVVELGRSDALQRWQYLSTRFGAGNFYATVSIPGTGIVAGQELVTKQHFDAYLANSIFYEAPDFGNQVMNHNLKGGRTTLYARVVNVSKKVKKLKVKASVAYANPLELILSEAGQRHHGDNLEITIQARLPMSFETPLTIRYAAKTKKMTRIADVAVTPERAGNSLFRTANFVIRLPKSTKGSVRISAVATPGQFVNPVPKAPQSVRLNTFHSRGPTLEDTLSVRAKRDHEDEGIPKDKKPGPDEAKANFSGEWQVNIHLAYLMKLRLTQSGNKVTGVATRKDRGASIKGTLTGNKLTYTWTWTKGRRAGKTAKGAVTLSGSGQRFSGHMIHHHGQRVRLIGWRKK